MGSVIRIFRKLALHKVIPLGVYVIPGLSDAFVINVMLVFNSLLTSVFHLHAS